MHFGEIFRSDHDTDSVYLSTLPMFRCNGWCTAWALVVGGTQICLRDMRGEQVWELIDRHRVTHLNGAPTVVTTIMNFEWAHTLDRALVVTNGGAPPSPTTLSEMEAMGFTIVYGLTKTYCPYATCRQSQDGWRDTEQRTRMQSRQGIGMVQVGPRPDRRASPLRRDTRQRTRRRADDGRHRDARQQRHERLLAGP